MNNSIYPCLWFDGRAKEAADLYCSLFSNSKIILDTPLVVQFEIAGKKIMGLNGGEQIKINPSISLFASSETEDEIERIWNKLSEGGRIMMALDKYPWSEKYGWVQDKFGMTWQLTLGKLPASGQKIAASFLFVGEQYGKAQEAMKRYTSIFPNSQIHSEQIYQAGEAQPEGNLKYGQFSLNGEDFAAMDGFGAHDFTFNWGVSIVVECETQAEIDHYWDKLIEDGGKESMCGWLLDPYVVNWQIIPAIIGSLMTDPEKGPRVMQAVLKMKKLDLETLLNA